MVDLLTSARSITLFPSGQMTWSTWERTLSQVSSGVRRLAWKRRGNQSPSCVFMIAQHNVTDGTVSLRTNFLEHIYNCDCFHYKHWRTTSISVLECPMLQTMEPFFIRSSWSLVTTFLFPAIGQNHSPSFRVYHLLLRTQLANSPQK